MASDGGTGGFPRNPQNQKDINWKGGGHYFQEESLNFEKLVDLITEIVCKKKNSDILNWAVNAARY